MNSLPPGHKNMKSQQEDDKNNSFLPTYEVAMKRRRELNKLEGSTSQFTDDSNQNKGNDTTPSIPPHFFDHLSDGAQSESSNTHPPPSTVSSSSHEQNSDTRRRFTLSSLPRRFDRSRPVSSANSSLLSTTGIPHLPNGRVSPTKSPAAFSLKQGDATLQATYNAR